MTSAPIAFSGFTPRHMDRDTKGPALVTVTAIDDYDLNDATIAFAFPTAGIRPTSYTPGQWRTQAAQLATAQSRALTLTPGTYDAYAKVGLKGQSYVERIGRLHVS